jgi:hypothetical protein
MVKSAHFGMNEVHERLNESAFLLIGGILKYLDLWPSYLHLFFLFQCSCIRVLECVLEAGGYRMNE